MSHQKTIFSSKPKGRNPYLNRWLLVFFFGFLSGVIGRYYGLLIYGDASDADFFRGGRTGFTIGFLIAAFEVFYIRSQRRSWFRRAAFLPGLLMRILVLMVIIRVGMVFNGLLTNYMTGSAVTLEVFKFSEQFRDTLFSLAVVVVFVTISQLTSIIGGKRFVNMVAGRYFKPVSENRIFLFVDVVDSTKLARELGNVRFHEFLSEFFYTIDHAIVSSGGEIVSYVGDAVIVTWPLREDKKKNGRCLVAINQMAKDVENHADFFMEKFSVTAKFRLALHGGKVVVGECGDSRKQITFLGDVVNTTARIENACKETGENYLISDVLAQQLELPESVSFEKLGMVKLKGIVEPYLLHKIAIT
ncbi:MAG: adenylate/guanylate cyclase domain-containing protein [Rhizobiaceae bacterium]